MYALGRRLLAAPDRSQQRFQMYFFGDTAADLPTDSSALVGDRGWALDTNTSYTFNGSAWTQASFTGAYADLTGKPTLGTAAATASTDYATAAQGTDARTPTAHVHAAADVTSGTFDVARLGTGATAGKYLRGDSTWQTIAGGGDLLAANNLSDVASAATARTNLGLGTAATTAATDYATAAQGTKADTALQNVSTAWPIGSVFISVVSTNPATLLGFGTWSAFGAGRMLVGLDSGDTDFDAVEEVGGAKTKTIAQANLPNISTGAGTAHTHTQNAHTHDFLPRSATTGSVSSIVTGTLDTSSTISGANQPHVQNQTATNQNESAHTHSLGGSGTALNVVNPYIVVYMFKRTA